MHVVLTGFALVVIGTGFLFLTVETGDVAAEHVVKTPEIQSVLHDHEELAETTQVVFGTLTFLLAALLFGPRLLKREVTIQSFRVAILVFLFAYIGGILSLVNTAHAGGRLVHELGVTAKITSTSK